MKNTGKCPKCNSTNILKDLKILDRGENHVHHDASLEVMKYPNAFIFKNRQAFSMRAWVCVDCGYVENYLVNPRELKQAVSNQQP